MTSGDVIRIARERASLTQAQLAHRVGVPRSSVARWETGEREPSLARLREIVAAADLDLVISLVNADSSYDDVIADQLALPPRKRLRRLLPPDELRNAQAALRCIAALSTPSVLIGRLAAALQGAPQQLDSGRAEVVAADPGALERELDRELVRVESADRWGQSDRRLPYALPRGGTVMIAREVPGGGEYRSLRRSAEDVDVPGGSLAVAHPRDLLRLAEASPRDEERTRVPALRALLDHRNALAHGR